MQIFSLPTQTEPEVGFIYFDEACHVQVEVHRRDDVNYAFILLVSFQGFGTESISCVFILVCS